MSFKLQISVETLFIRQHFIAVKVRPQGNADHFKSSWMRWRSICAHAKGLCYSVCMKVGLKHAGGRSAQRLVLDSVCCDSSLADRVVADNMGTGADGKMGHVDIVCCF